MNQLERIQLIYTILEKRAISIDDLYTTLLAKGIQVKSRQLYLDVKQLEKYYLRADEQIVIKTGLYNKKTYWLQKTNQSKEISTFDINSFQLSRITLPRILSNERESSLKKFRDILDEKVLSQNKITYTYLDSFQIVNTHFYEAEYSSSFHKTMEDLIWAISNQKIVIINSIEGDATSLPKKIRYPFQFKPLMIIYHRGQFFVTGYSVHNNLFLVFDVSKISDYTLSNKSFYSTLLQQNGLKEMQKRFGISSNIDNKVYNIELEFSSITGDFVSKYQWHDTQQFSKLPNGNWKYRMQCGINRELLGWIFQWLNNVKIIKPKILEDVYETQLQLMKNNAAKHHVLQYKNVFKAV